MILKSLFFLHLAKIFKTKGAALVIFAIIGCWPFLFHDPYSLRLFTLAGIQILLVLGYQLIFGHIGALSLAQGCFFGLGAYMAGILARQTGLDFTVIAVCAIVFPGLVAACIAIPVLRLETHYFALATLALSQMVLILGLEWQAVTGGANGLSGIIGLNFFGWPVSRGAPFAWLVWLAVGLGAWLVWLMTRGSHRHRLALIRETPLMASAMGLDRDKMRFWFFLASAGFAGLAGAFHVYSQTVVSPAVLHFDVLVTCLAMTVIGGQTRIAGAFLGGLLLLHLPEWFRFLEGWALFAYGLALLLVILLAPEGIFGLFECGWRRFWRSFFPEPEQFSDQPAPSVKAQNDPQRPAVSARAQATVPEKPILTVEHLCKNYGGVQALQDFALTLTPGEIVGLIGPNGSGKTTAINLLSGLEKADQGAIHVQGPDGGRNKPRIEMTKMAPFQRARLGLQRSFQTPEFPKSLTVKDCLTVTLQQAPSLSTITGDRSKPPETIDACLDSFQLRAYRDHLCHTLPLPLIRRLDLARALSVTPSLLLLDEPAAGLPAQDLPLLSFHLRRAADQGCAILIVEHGMAFLTAITDRLLCLDQGRLIAAGTVTEVLQSSPVQQAYFGRKISS